MEIVSRIIIGLLSAALCAYAIKELLTSQGNVLVATLAIMLLIFGLCGLVESLKQHSNQNDQ